LVIAALRGDAPIGQSRTSTPADHLLIMVFDQMRPDYIDRFGLKNFQALRAASRHYPEAYVGHLGSQTVVSHLVITTGLLPKSLPWQDNAMVDWDGALGQPGASYLTLRFGHDQMRTLLRAVPPSTFLAPRLRKKTGGRVFAIGEKDYATIAMGVAGADSIVTLARASGRCTPSGINVPDYIATNPRYALDCAETYGTGLSTVYSLDGNHYVPGTDTAHLGGDVWTADAAIDVMGRENWAGLFLTFGAIDKVAHMLADHDQEGLRSVQTPYRLAEIAGVADAQLGRLVAELKKRDLYERTVIVVTADHGGQKNEFYLGNNKYQGCCGFANDSVAVEPSYWIEHLKQLGKLQATYQDTSVKVWLSDRSAANETAIVAGLADISGMAEVYALRQAGTGWRYERVFSRVDRLTPAFRRWAAQRHQELADTMATGAAPHLLGLLADGFGFGRIGDHGGAQERVQRIPLLIRVPGERGSRRSTPMRLVDIAAEVSRTMDLQPVAAVTR
jgi:hypothetical protein